MTISGHFFNNYMFIFHNRRFRRSFWGSDPVEILIGTNVMTQKPKISKTQKTQLSLFFTELQKKRKWKYLDFVSQHFEKLGFRSVEYTKMTVWDSGLWKINIHMAKKWPEPIIEQSFRSNIRFQSVFTSFLNRASNCLHYRRRDINSQIQLILVLHCTVSYFTVEKLEKYQAWKICIVHKIAM